MYPDLRSFESTTVATETLVLGVAPVKMYVNMQSLQNCVLNYWFLLTDLKQSDVTLACMEKESKRSLFVFLYKFRDPNDG